jgi:hypothetical protein
VFADGPAAHHKGTGGAGSAIRGLIEVEKSVGRFVHGVREERKWAGRRG